jgi:hypothetical protein
MLLTRKFSIHILFYVILASNILLLCSSALALQLPTQLTSSDLKEMTQLLGFSTSTKFLSNPYSLGGYSGLEVGLSSEFINVTDLAPLGATTPPQSTFQYNRITIGKGMYNDVDLFIHFIPFSVSNDISDYGGSIKWSFYHARYLPFTLSIVGQYNSLNIQDLFLNENIGWDFIGGLNLQKFALYFGGGNQAARSTFSKNILDPALPTNSDYALKTRSSQIHSFIGIEIDIKSFFVAAQIDRYEQPVYSAKLGVRL